MLDYEPPTRRRKSTSTELCSSLYLSVTRFRDWTFCSLVLQCKIIYKNLRGGLNFYMISEAIDNSDPCLNYRTLDVKKKGEMIKVLNLFIQFLNFLQSVRTF